MMKFHLKPSGAAHECRAGDIYVAAQNSEATVVALAALLDAARRIDADRARAALLKLAAATGELPLELTNGDYPLSDQDAIVADCMNCERKTTCKLQVDPWDENLDPEYQHAPVALCAPCVDSQAGSI